MDVILNKSTLRDLQLSLDAEGFANRQCLQRYQKLNYYDFIRKVIEDGTKIYDDSPEGILYVLAKDEKGWSIGAFDCRGCNGAVINVLETELLTNKYEVFNAWIAFLS